MFKKSFLVFAFLTVFTAFYGFYFRSGASADGMPLKKHAWHMLLPKGTYAISAYDNMMRHIGAKEGQDWRLMSAIAYHESRFQADVVSPGGAVGLMQIMPSVARQFDVPVSSIGDPVTNIRLAGRVLEAIQHSLHFAPGTSATDRMSIILASYNGGIGHVQDARRLAGLYGENPDSWAVVARYLQLKSEPEYYNSDVVSCGRFTGSGQTLAYVNDVLGRYDKYCRIAEK